MLEPLIKSAITILSAVSGAALTFSFRLNHHKLCALISLSAGALFGAAIFTLLPESREYLGILELLIGVASGYMLFWLISKYYAHICPACSATHFDEKTTKKFSEIFRTLFTALAFHSFLDGVAITTGVGEHHHSENSIFTAILIHKFPEGLALAALMLGAGYTKTKIIFYVFLVELTTLLGAVGGHLFLKEAVSGSFIAIIMAHISGGFIYLAIHAILGELFRNHKALVVGSFATGLGLIYLTILLAH